LFVLDTNKCRSCPYCDDMDLTVTDDGKRQFHISHAVQL